MTADIALNPASQTPFVPGGEPAVGEAPRPFSLSITRADLERRLAALRTRRECGELSAAEYRILRRGAYAAYSESKPLRRKARRRVQTCLEAGEMEKPSVCSWIGCGVRSGLEAHHWNYQMATDIVWYCSQHHNLADLALARGYIVSELGEFGAAV